MSVAERELDVAGRRIPFDANHGRGQFLARRLLAAVRGHRLLDGGFQSEQALHRAVMRLHRNEPRMGGGQGRHVPIVDRALLGELAVGAARPDDNAIGHLVAKRLCLLLPECRRGCRKRISDQGSRGRWFARDANALLRPRLSQVLSVAGRRSLCLPALLALESGDRQLTAIG